MTPNVGLWSPKQRYKRALCMYVGIHTDTCTYMDTHIFPPTLKIMFLKRMQLGNLSSLIPESQPYTYHSSPTNVPRQEQCNHCHYPTNGAHEEDITMICNILMFTVPHIHDTRLFAVSCLLPSRSQFHHLQNDGISGYYTLITVTNLKVLSIAFGADHPE